MTTTTKSHHRRRPINTSKILSLSKPTPLMASLLSLSLFSLLLVLLFSLSSSSSATRHHHQIPKHDTISSPIQQACKATRYPDTCESTLTQFNKIPPNPTPFQIIQSAISISSSNLETAVSMVKSILDSSGGNLNRTTAANNCLETLKNSQYRISRTIEVLPLERTKDMRAWLSAALAFQYDCWSSLKYANDTTEVGKTMSFLNDLINYTSNGLSMVVAYDIFGKETGSWSPPKTERDGFWEPTGSGDIGFKGGRGVPSNLKENVTVCKDGSDGCYKTIQEAVSTAPEAEYGNRFVIRIREGVYEETVRVPLEKKNVVFLGDGMGKTVITGSGFSGQPGITTYNSATVGVVGDGFMASNITFENKAGPDAHQAVAFRSDSDLSVIENCEFLGNQDTLYAHTLRQFYKSCRIQGNVDFIFGNSATIFHQCQILIRPRQVNPEKGENNAITAHGRIDPAQSTGFVFQNCVINGTEEYMKLYYSKPQKHNNFLGRPWKEYSRTVFISSYLEAIITPQGWMPWSGDFALKTLYYSEFQNSGPGSNLSQRVSWSSQIPDNHVNSYSVQNFIQGSDWIPTSC